MKCDVVLAGVGGQGILSVAAILAEAARRQGLFVKEAEVHGMAQRGGSVQATLRISPAPIASELIALGSPAELKEAMAEEVIDISCDQPQAALAIVDTLPGVHYAALFGRGLHAVTDCAGATIPLIADRLAAAGLAAGRPERILPSLEDVFVSLIETRDRQMAPVTAVTR